MDTIVIAIAAVIGALIVAGVEILRRRRRGRAVTQSP
jgi:biotin operon repressor